MTEPRPTLPHPLRELLVDEPSPHRMAKIWRKVSAGRGVRRSSPMLRPALALGALAVLAWWLLQPPTPAVEAPRPLASLPAPILPAQRAAAPIEPRPSAPKIVELGPGASASVQGDATLNIVIDEPDRMALRLDHGHIELDVEAAPERAWSLDCGLAKLELFGARVSVDRSDRRLVIALERGAVELRGPGVPGGVRRLEAPTSMTLEPEPRILPKRAAIEPSLPLPEASAPPAAPPAEVWSAERLLEAADRARGLRQHALAVELLGRLVAEYPDDPRSAPSAFTKGRLELDELGRPADAARSLERAFELGLPSALQEDGLYRLWTAHRALGDLRGAAEVEARYRRQFPEGRRLETEAPGAPRR